MQTPMACLERRIDNVQTPGTKFFDYLYVKLGTDIFIIGACQL